MTCDDVTGIDFNLDVQKVSEIAIEEVLVIKTSSDCDSCASYSGGEPIKPYLQPHALRALASKVDLVLIWSSDLKP